MNATYNFSTSDFVNKRNYNIENLFHNLISENSYNDNLIGDISQVNDNKYFTSRSHELEPVYELFSDNIILASLQPEKWHRSAFEKQFHARIISSIVSVQFGCSDYKYTRQCFSCVCPRFFAVRGQKMEKRAFWALFVHLYSKKNIQNIFLDMCLIKFQALIKNIRLEFLCMPRFLRYRTLKMFKQFFPWIFYKNFKTFSIFWK